MRHQFSLEVREDGDRSVIAPAGEIDLATAPELRSAFEAVCASSPSQIVFDFERVTFMDSTGVSLLIGASDAAAAYGGVVSVVNPSSTVMRVLEITGMSERLGVQR